MNVRGACACFVVVTIRTGLRQTLIGKTIDFLIVGYTIVDIKIQERNKKKTMSKQLAAIYTFLLLSYEIYTNPTTERKERERDGAKKTF